MRCLLLLPLVALSVISYATSADTLGVRAGANYWKYDISGTARYQTKNSANDIDLNQDLGYDNGSAGVYYLVQVELKQTDITLYYELLDNVVSLDLGLAGKYIDSKARITGEISGTQDASVSGWVPLVYLGAGADLPLTGLGVSADGSFAKYQDSTFYDYSIRATYTTPWMLGLDVGYRKIKLDLDDFDNSFANVEFDGPYAGAYLHF
jgi:hypothetical protein